MKKNKLSLNKLSVQSFVTKQTDLKSETLKGGGTHYSFCSFDACDCPDTITVIEPWER